jgi:hypothetical protein
MGKKNVEGIRLIYFNLVFPPFSSFTRLQLSPLFSPCSPLFSPRYAGGESRWGEQETGPNLEKQGKEQNSIKDRLSNIHLYYAIT